MKRLFHEKFETYTPEAIEISKEIGVEIRKLIENYCIDQDFSANDIGQLLIDEVTINISEFKLIRNINFKKEERSKDAKME
ncbi:MAG: hypothetical protein EOL97_14465 [Spirochaetia bacterium]|nr:hypothetical protein [Spirochaetia bacterium]